ncbi:MAG: phospholipase D family protein [Candidatus Nitrosopelagicus sp.]|jgi:phosphatidylserine/phosphatidylglycerophosphate/cardiolipin synthase-like enzyme|nr:phospholipase D family protein [Candidatus Nitrosopelagicus sp.]
MKIMQTHIGRGVGKYIEDELFKAKDYVKICSPNISYSLCKRLFDLLNNDVKIQVITSDIITGDKNSVQANSLAKDTLKKLHNTPHQSNLQYKAISTSDIPLIHAKLYLIDGKCAIMGSANLTENSFGNFVEYILVTHENDMVRKIENDFETFWNHTDSYPNQITTKSLKKFLKNFKKKP